MSRDQDMPARERWLDLLAGEAAGDLSPAERAELAARRLASPGGRVDREGDDLMRVAALAQLAFLKREGAACDSLPPQLQARLMEQAGAWADATRKAAGKMPPKVPVVRAAPVDAPREGTPRPPAHDSRATGRSGWLLAAGLAAALLIAIGLRPDGLQPPDDPAGARQALLAAVGDTVVLEWAASDQPGYEAATGDVVWNAKRQEGYLRLRGLPPNRPDDAQYQLWIVAPGRDVHPVDGGVFDVPSSDEVVIPIDARLAVDHAAAFAITLERPGGVVVSDGPLLLIASAGS